ncbi:flagellar motor switch protein FliG [Puniceibacterium sp. IMCC21224]|uniref:flagellar motor switch protein FliG n=1 Tax=Puniceibacterium sp. IMCC21224 TaxID=1618204 RepID=UPI00064E05DF|nr:FliG C-terminal domain-containing protein [Puniceibacterium sp. IMCC21224]KMK66529.1 flagellar motor switch protein [Puniceibacterium sp. IMCC21224]
MSNLTSLAALPGPSRGAANPTVLTRRAKAAIIVQFILNEGADVPLSALPEDLQSQLTQQLGAMRYVDRDTLNSVVGEFADELDQIGMSFPGDIAGALSALDGRISPQTARRLRKEAGVRQAGDPWARIAALSVERLQQIVLTESTEIAAVLLSKIDVNKAATLLGRLPGTRARRITYAVSMTAGVTPEAVDRIGLSLASQLDAEPPKAFGITPSDRVGAILNFSASRTRDDVLSGLDEEDSTFAEAVRRAIFTFANIPDRLNPNDVPKITRDVDAATLTTVFAFASSEEDLRAVDFLCENMSKRMSASLREDADAKGKVKQKVGEEAVTIVIRAIRDMVTSGEITFLSPEDDEDGTD